MSCNICFFSTIHMTLQCTPYFYERHSPESLSIQKIKGSFYLCRSKYKIIFFLWKFHSKLITVRVAPRNKYGIIKKISSNSRNLNLHVNICL